MNITEGKFEVKYKDRTSSQQLHLLKSAVFDLISNFEDYIIVKRKDVNNDQTVKFFNYFNITTSDLYKFLTDYVVTCDLSICGDILVDRDRIDNLLYTVYVKNAKIGNFDSSKNKEPFIYIKWNPKNKCILACHTMRKEHERLYTFAESKKNKNIVYHVGDFSRKAGDTDLFSLNNGRSTGFFGTGHYFCTEWEYCVRQGGGHRPLYSIDISNYKLLNGSIELHEALRKANRYISSYGLILKYSILDNSYIRMLLSTLSKLTYDFECSLGDCLKDDYEYQKERYVERYGHYEWSEYVDDTYDLRHLIELCKENKELKDLYKELTSDSPSFDKINNLQKDINYNEEDLKRVNDLLFQKKFFIIELGISESKFDKLAEEIYYDLEKWYEDGYLRTSQHSQLGLDSIPTRIIKYMDYDGIMPNRDTDNISYGGIIYDLDLSDTKLLAIDVSEFEGDELNENRLNENLSYSQIIDKVFYTGNDNWHLKKFYDLRKKYNGKDVSNVKLITTEINDEGYCDILFSVKVTNDGTIKKELVDDGNGEMIDNISNEYMVTIRINDFWNMIEEFGLETPNDFTKGDVVALVQLSEDIKLKSSDPSFWWQGLSYWLSLDNASLMPCNIAPKFWDKYRPNVKVSKIIEAVLRQFGFFTQQISMSIKKALIEQGYLTKK